MAENWREPDRPKTSLDLLSHQLQATALLRTYQPAGLAQSALRQDPQPGGVLHPPGPLDEVGG